MKSPPRYDAAIILPATCLPNASRCLGALAAVTDGVEFEVIVVDNSTNDDTAGFLAQLSGDVQVLRSEAALPLADAWNQGARAASARFLVFLTDGVVPVSGWLEALAAQARATPQAGAVGSRIVTPAGTIHHAGVAFARDSRLPFHPYQRPVVLRRPLRALRRACLPARLPRPRPGAPRHGVLLLGPAPGGALRRSIPSAGLPRTRLRPAPLRRAARARLRPGCPREHRQPRAARAPLAPRRGAVSPPRARGDGGGVGALARPGAGAPPAARDRPGARPLLPLVCDLSGDARQQRGEGGDPGPALPPHHPLRGRGAPPRAQGGGLRRRGVCRLRLAPGARPPPLGERRGVRRRLPPRSGAGPVRGLVRGGARERRRAAGAGAHARRRDPGEDAHARGRGRRRRAHGHALLHLAPGDGPRGRGRGEPREPAPELDRQSLAILHRLLTYPTGDEAARLGSLHREENFFSEHFVPINNGAARAHLREGGVAALLAGREACWPHGLLAEELPRVSQMLALGWDEPRSLARLGEKPRAEGEPLSLSAGEQRAVQALLAEVRPDRLVVVGERTPGDRRWLRTFMRTLKALPTWIEISPAGDFVEEISEGLVRIAGPLGADETLGRARKLLRPTDRNLLIVDGTTGASEVARVLCALGPFLGQQAVVALGHGARDDHALREGPLRAAAQWLVERGRPLGFEIEDGWHPCDGELFTVLRRSRGVARRSAG